MKKNKILDPTSKQFTIKHKTKSLIIGLPNHAPYDAILKPGSGSWIPASLYNTSNFFIWANTNHVILENLKVRMSVWVLSRL